MKLDKFIFLFGCISILILLKFPIVSVLKTSLKSWFVPYFYSIRRASIGFCKAAFTANRLTVSIQMKVITKMGNKYIHHFTSKWFAKLANHLWINKWDKGKAINKATMMYLKYWFVMSRIIWDRFAPNTFLIAISFCCLETVYMTRPNNPRLAMSIAKKEKLENSFPKACSFWYCWL